MKDLVNIFPFDFNRMPFLFLGVLLGAFCCLANTSGQESAQISPSNLPFSPVITETDQKKLDDAILICQEETDDKSLTDCFLYLANLHYEYGSYDQALQFYEQSLALKQKLDIKTGFAQVYGGMAEVHLAQGRLNQTIHFYRQAIEQATSPEEEFILLATKSKLSSAYVKQGDYLSAHQELQESLKIIGKSHSNPAEEARTHRELGVLYGEIGLDSLAIKHLHFSLDLGNTNNDDLILAHSYFALGDFYLQQAQINKAKTLFRQGFQIAQTNKDVVLLSMGHLSLAKVDYEQGLFELSRAHLLKVINFHARSSFGQKAEALAYLGLIQVQHEDAEKAINHCAEGYDLALQTAVPRLMRLNCQCLRQAYQLDQQYKKALEMADQVEKLSSGLNQVSALKKITAGQLALEVGKVVQDQKNQTTLFAAANALQAEQVQNQKNRIVWLSAVSVLTALLGLILFWLYRSRKKLNEQLAELNQDLNEVNTHLEFKNKALKTSNHKLFENNEALDNFAAVAAHDLKAPLRTISSFSQLLYRILGKTIDKSQKEYFQFITESAKQLSKMIDDLLAFSRMGKDMPKPTPVDINAVLTQVEGRLKTVLDEKNGEIIFDPLPGVMAQQSLLTQLFQNLIHNSLKFSRNGVPPKINIRLEPNEDLTKHYFVLSDNGIGIPEAQLEAVFGIFRRLYIDRYEGSGVGLASCKKIVEHFDGEIWMTSKEGQGTQTHIKLPKID